MINKNDNETDIELDITNTEDIESDETELVDIEENSDIKLKELKEKIVRLEYEKKEILDDSQRTKADFLNARKRLEEEKIQDRIRQKKRHIEELLPLCDSFQMAMSNKEAWEKADETWRSGVEGIYNQLTKILESYNVSPLNPVGEIFSPHLHEAVGMEEVEDEKLKDKVITVVQSGYEIKTGDTTELIRPAKVTTGKIKE